MEKNEKQLQEQDAPRKNGDNAFVQVGKDGEPVIPQGSDKKEQQADKSDRVTTLDKR